MVLINRLMLIAAAFVAGAAPQADSLDGVWRSQGYGYAFAIEGPTLKAFEVTDTTCLPSFTAQRDDTVMAGREATFKKGGELYFIRTGGSRDHKLLHYEGSASDMRIDRLPALPAVCGNPTPNTPADNFEVFARTWAEHYILFEQKKTIWAKVVASNRSKITPDTTPSDLFDVLESMITGFNDAHTFISAPEINRQFRKLRPGTDRVIKAGSMAEFRSKDMPVLLAATEHAYIKTPLRKWCNNQVQYGHIDDATGYLRILSFSGYSKQGGFLAGLEAFEEALDAIFSDPALKALVIDVRINFGGYDPYGLALASRLATGEYLAYTKYARADAADRNRWTSGDPTRVRPSSRPGFRGPAVELIGPLTISAGETCTQALMGRAPHITRVGENTQGVFSDVLARSLPNRWHFGLPNEVFRTEQGTTFDGPGIRPDIAVPVFADAAVAAGRDPVMAKALEVLRKK